MKIAMMTNNYKPYRGGVPVSVERLSAGLRRRGHDVYIFAPEYGSEPPSSDSAENVIRYASLKHRVDGFAVPVSSDPVIKRELRRINPDIIHTHHPMLIGRRALRFGGRFSAPVVYTYHTRYEQYLHHIKPLGMIENAAESRTDLFGRAMSGVDGVLKERLVPAYMRGFIRRCDMVFSPSGLIENIIDDFGVSTPHRLLATGVDSRFFRADAVKAAELRKTLGGGKSLLFCTVTRLAKEKNIEFILRALAEYKRRFGDDFKYVLIGDGPQQHELSALASHLGLAENVTFAGSVDNSEVHNYYAACDLFLFASKSETQGIVLLEAMAASLPVAAVRAGGVEDVVINGINGFMTGENISDFAGRIYMLAANNAYNGEYGRRARLTAMQNSIDKMAESAEQGYYQAMLQKSKRLAEKKIRTADSAM